MATLDLQPSILESNSVERSFIVILNANVYALLFVFRRNERTKLRADVFQLLGEHFHMTILGDESIIRFCACFWLLRQIEGTAESIYQK